MRRRYEMRAIAKRANGEKELQRKIARLLNTGWIIDEILPVGFRLYTIVATRKVRLRG